MVVYKATYIGLEKGVVFGAYRLMVGAPVEVTEEIAKILKNEKDKDDNPLFNIEATEATEETDTSEEVKE